MHLRKITAALGAMRRNAIAWLALFMALGGTGYAAATIGPGDIRDDAVRARHIAEGAVWSGQLQDGAIRTRDLGDGAVGSQAIRNGRVFSADIRDGTVRGADVSTEIPSGLVLVRHQESVFGTEADETVTARVTCPDSAPSVVGGGGHLIGGFDGEHMIVSNAPEPGAQNDSWRVAAVESSRGTHPSGWGVSVSAICAKAEVPIVAVP